MEDLNELGLQGWVGKEWKDEKTGSCSSFQLICTFRPAVSKDSASVVLTNCGSEIYGSWAHHRTPAVPPIWETEVGGLQVQGWPWQFSKTLS